MNSIDTLIALTKKQNIDLIHKILIESIKNNQFDTLNEYLKELYKIVGYSIKLEEFENLYIGKILKNKNSDTPIHIIIIPKLSRPMNLEDIRTIFSYSNMLINKYDCKDFKILSINNYNGISDEEYDAINNLGLSLYGFDHISFLITYISITNGKSQLLTLYNHNEKAYRKTIDMMRNCNRVAIVQATGTGKSKLLLSIAQRDFYNKNILIVAPGLEILNEFKLASKQLNIPNIKYLTYKGLYEIKEDKLRNLNCELILLDEIHRLGAETFLYGFNRLTKSYPNVKIVGVTATPVRTLDNNRDITEELFYGNVSNIFHLEEAISSGVLPSPKYISAVYDIQEELDDLKDMIKSKNINDKEKSFYLRELENVKINWDASTEIVNIIKKHITPNIRKILVFCESEKHLNDSIPMVSNWFRKAGFDVNITSITSEQDNITTRREKLDRFRNVNNPNSIELLFSINILNEGVHVSDANGAIFLRRTTSEILYLQQLGRVLEANKKDTPVVFDFVCNFSNIKHNALSYKVELASDKFDYYNTLLKTDNNSFNGFQRTAIIKSYDESEHIGRIFENLRQSISDNWTYNYKKLFDYYNKHGNSNIFKNYKKDIILYIWAVNQIKAYHNGCLSPEKVRMLNKIRFNWHYFNNSTWHKNFFILSSKMSDIKMRGYSKVLKERYSKINRWCSAQRSAFNKGYLKEDKIALLNSIGFDWSIQEKKWIELYIEFRQYFAIYEDLNTVKSKSSKIKKWIDNQSIKLQENKLEEYKIILLNSVTTKWSKHSYPNFNYTEEIVSSIETQWILNYIKLYKYAMKEGHIKVPKKYTQDKSFGYWVHKQKTLYNKGELSSEKANLIMLLLDDINLKE